MILTVFFLAISLGVSGIIFYFAELYAMWYNYFYLLIFIPLFYLLIFGIYVAILYVITLFMNRKKEVDYPKRFWYFWIKQTAFQLLFLSRTRVKTEGIDQLEKNKRYMVITNHLSTFDPMLAITKLKLDPLMCVTKKENMDIPICGPFIHHAGFISLDRGDMHSAVDMVKKATKYLNEDLSHIYICPEGTRSKTGELLPFHPGSFKIAKRANVEIAVCYVENTNKIAKNFPLKKTKASIRLLRIITKEEIESKTTIELADLAQSIMQNYKEKKDELFTI